jgi:hypothetical protein
MDSVVLFEIPTLRSTNDNLERYQTSADVRYTSYEFYNVRNSEVFAASSSRKLRRGAAIIDALTARFDEPFFRVQSLLRGLHRVHIAPSFRRVLAEDLQHVVFPLFHACCD